MNKMLLAVCLSIAALAGCATTTTARPMVADPLPPPVAAPVPPPVPQYAPPPMAAPVPPARPEAMMGPPQSWAWLNSPPYGCERGPYSLAIANDTGYFMRVTLDGEELQVRGAYGVLPHLPPHSVAYVCLSHLEEHVIAGVAYAPRMGVLQEVPGRRGSFSHVRQWGLLTLEGGHHEFHIDDMELLMN